MIKLYKGLIIPYDHLREDCLSEATKIANSTQGRRSRSKEKHFTDALNGLMLQYAVAEYFISGGLEISQSKTLAVDFVINDQLLIDVKGRFEKSATCYAQSDWEHLTVNQQELNLIYLCFDCRGGTAIFEGGISRENIQTKSSFSGWIMYPNQLKNFEFDLLD